MAGPEERGDSEEVRDAIQAFGGVIERLASRVRLFELLGGLALLLAGASIVVNGCNAVGARKTTGQAKQQSSGVLRCLTESESPAVAAVCLNVEAAQAGRPGQAGRSGRAGAKGAKGARGLVGEKGEKGARGSKGERGEKGAPGEEGAPGAAGAPGSKGEAGAQGQAGPEGEKGQKGEKGERGEKGEPGADGAPGPMGLPGVDGAPGTPGMLVLSVETCLMPGLMATDPDGDGNFTCPVPLAPVVGGPLR